MADQHIEVSRGVRIVGAVDVKNATQAGGVTILPHAKYIEHQPTAGFEVSVDSFDPDNPSAPTRHLPPLDVGRLPDGWSESAYKLAADRTDDDVLRRELAYMILAKWQAEADAEVEELRQKAAPPKASADEFVRPGYVKPEAPKPVAKPEAPMPKLIKKKKPTLPRQETAVAKPLREKTPAKSQHPLPKLPVVAKKKASPPLPLNIAKLLNIPDLRIESPAAPTIDVRFDFGAMGRQRATYHWAALTESVLLLIYDTRFEYADPFIPPLLGMDHVVDIQLLKKGSAEKYAYRCFGQNTCFEFGVFHFVLFIRDVEEETSGLAEQENALRQMQLNGDQPFADDPEDE